jgi:adenosine deaminase
MLSYPDYLRLLPKVELHCHFVATIRARTLVELARTYGVALPSTDPRTLFDVDNIVDFLSVLDAACKVFRNRDDLARVAYEGVEDAVAAGNLRYREYFLNPFSFSGLSYTDVIDGAIDGLQAAEQDFGVGFGIIAAIDRSAPPTSGVELVTAMICNPRAEVVGLGQDNLTSNATESPELWTDAYRLAAVHSINRTAHVGAVAGSGAENVVAAMRRLGCTRIDHGYDVLTDPAAVETARVSQIPFTCTPTSSTVLRGWELGPDHPIAAMIRAGLNVTFSSDDPTFFGTDIGREYSEALPAMGFGPDVARRIALAGLDAAWCDPRQKTRLRSEFQGQIRALDALLDEPDTAVSAALAG